MSSRPHFDGPRKPTAGATTDFCGSDRSQQAEVGSDSALGLKLKIALECPWEPIHGFKSPTEFRRSSEWVSDQIASRVARTIERPVDELHVGGSATRYLEHIGSSQIWRLDEPDGSFNGSFHPIVRRDTTA
jgi:hypothetical protein